MGKPSYPTGSDIEGVIRSLALFDPDDLSSAFELLDTDTFAAAAVRQWEEETGWIPFLADVRAVVDGGVVQTRYFDPPGPNTRPWTLGGDTNLHLGCGLVELSTVHIGWSPTTAGTAQLAGTDFILWPYNADPLDRPWTELHFLVRQWGQRQSIKVVGRFGYASAVPDDAWLAILHRGVSLALPEVAVSIAGGVIEFQEAGVTERYGDAFLTGQKGIGGMWKQEWLDTVRRYVRIVV